MRIILDKKNKGVKLLISNHIMELLDDYVHLWFTNDEGSWDYELINNRFEF